MSVRLLRALRSEPDWSAMSDAGLSAFQQAENRRRSAPMARLISGFPARGVTIGWTQVTLPGRSVPVRMYRPAAATGDLPLVVHVHGGGFVGTAVQCDWISSHVAARVPAVVVSVEHRLVGPAMPLSAAVDDGWEVLRRTAEWGTDPERVAVFGESAGGLIAAMAAIRARDVGLRLRAQVLVNPCVDLTETAVDYPSMKEHADSAMLTVPQMMFFRRMAVADQKKISPLYVDELAGLAPALVVVPTADPVADQGRAYAERLRGAGVAVTVTEHPGAPHAFLSLPHLVPRARTARTEIIDFLTERLR
ncbi:alpha/beta hydrolase [Actinoplanes cyaneus]|uniref:Alpha/beta hydrolase n=1 Tax=Actinoplanes cyaneus TaxID=52696 RepID=A0A919IUU6_9ACTN|nr:alpha/beta hydrolase [Actinoplanes cyaneus]MCW2144151.1 Acetyl esterase/lipase [Actinoplanes cyaneus]GID70907.1 alpha/beta hydrolase [Actinoplanes cyaneus]